MALEEGDDHDQSTNEAVCSENGKSRPVFLTSEERYQVWTVKAAERPFLLEKYSEHSPQENDDDDSNSTTSSSSSSIYSSSHRNQPPLTDGCDIPRWRQASMISTSVAREAVLGIGSGSTLLRRERQWPIANKTTTTNTSMSKWKRIQEQLWQDPLPEPSLSSSGNSSSSMRLQRLTPMCMEYSELQTLYPHRVRRPGDPAPSFERASMPAMIRGVTTSSSSWNMSQLSWTALCRRFGEYEWRFSDTHGACLTLETYERYCQSMEGLVDDAPLGVYDSQFHTDARRALLEDFEVPVCFTHDLFDYLPEEEAEGEDNSSAGSEADDDAESCHSLPTTPIHEENNNLHIHDDDDASQNDHSLQDDEHSIDGTGVKPPYRWILMGPERSGTGIHIDPIGTHAWLTLTEGCKRWILFHPDTPPSAIGYLTHTDTGQQVPSVVWFDEWWIQGRLAKQQQQQRLDKPIQYVTFLQKPGDTVYVPAGWPHLVLNLERSVAVTQNYATEYPSLDHFWKGVEMDSTPEQQSALRRALEKYRPDLQLPIDRHETNETDATTSLDSTTDEVGSSPLLDLENADTPLRNAPMAGSTNGHNSESESNEIHLARPLWWLYCLHGGFTLALPTTALMYMLNTHVELPVSLLPSYGALAFCPFSLKPLYAYWAVRKADKRRYQLALLLLLNAVLWLGTAFVPRHGVLLFLAVAFARGVTTAWPELLLGLALVEQAHQYANVNSTAAAHLQTQAATARNVGSLAAHGLVVGFWVTWITIKGLQSNEDHDNTEPLLNLQTSTCLFVMASLSSFAAAVIAWKYRLGCDARHSERLGDYSYANLHNVDCEENNSDCIRASSPVSCNKKDPQMDPLLSIRAGVDDQEAANASAEAANQERQTNDPPFLSQEAIVVIALQVAVILLILQYPLKQELPSAGPWILYTCWGLCILAVCASFFLGRSNDTPSSHSRESASSSGPSSRAIYGVGLFLILRQIAPDASFLMGSFRYQAFESSPLMLQLLSMSEMLVLAAASWSFGRILSPLCTFPVGANREHETESARATNMFYWVLAGTGVLAGLASMSHLWFIHVVEHSQSAFLHNAVALCVGAWTTWTSEWCFLPKVILATHSVGIGQDNNDNSNSNYATFTVNDSSDCTEDHTHAMQNSTDLQKQRELQYGSLITCIDFGDQLGALVASGIVAWMGISRENHWEGLQGYVSLCSIGEILSLVWMLLLLYSLPSPTPSSLESDTTRRPPSRQQQRPFHRLRKILALLFLLPVDSVAFSFQPAPKKTSQPSHRVCGRVALTRSRRGTFTHGYLNTVPRLDSMKRQANFPLLMAGRDDDNDLSSAQPTKKSSSGPTNDYTNSTTTTFLTEYAIDSEQPPALSHAVHDAVNKTNTAATEVSLFAWLNGPSAAIGLLNVVAIIWGTQHAVIKTIVADNVNGSENAPIFTLVRFALAALFASPSTPGLENMLSFLNKNNSNDKQAFDMTQFGEPVTGAATTADSSTSTLWRWGAELGLWMFLGFAFQAIGLQFTTAQKSGFLLYLNVKFVPLLAWLLYGRSIPVVTWISAFTAFAGTFLLATSDGGALFTTANSDATAMAATVSSSTSWNIGDAWSMAAAVASAMFILRMERASAAVPSTQASQLNSACLWIVTALSVVWVLALDAVDVNPSTNAESIVLEARDMLQDSWPSFLYLSGIATAVCNFLQTKAQRYVSPERACVIYAMDPVYGALFSAWFLGESLPGVSGYVGVGLITAAAATNAFLETKEGTIDSEEAKETANLK